MSYVRCLLLRSTFAATAPRSAVAELGVVRRFVPSPDNDQVMSLPKFFTQLEFARRSLAARAAVVRSLSASSFARHATLSVLSNAFRGLIGLKAREGQPCGLLHASSTSGRRRLRPRRLHDNSTRTPNQALQRTAPRVTLAAADRPATFAHPAPAAFPQPARRAPQSLSFRSLGRFTSCPKT